MSVSIIKQPSELQPVYNQMVIAVTGSYQNQPNHNFVSTLQVNGVTASRLKVPTNPEGYGVFDIHKHVENRVEYNFDPSAVGLNPATNSFATYSLSFAEEFRYEFEFYDNQFTTGAFIGFIGLSGGSQPLFTTGDEIVVNQTAPFTNASYEGTAIVTEIQFITASNAWLVNTNKSFGVNTPPEGGFIYLSNFRLTTVGSTSSISKQFAWNGVYSHLDFINFDPTPFVPDSTTPAKWMTSIKTNTELDRDERMWLMAYKNADNQQKDLMIQTNNGTYRITSLYSAGVSTNDSYRFIHAAVGPWHLINATSSFTAIGTASFPMIDSNTKEYSVFYRNQILQQDTETLTFKLKSKCSKYEKIQLVFLDKLGSFIPFTFNLVSRKNKDIKRTDYSEITGQYAPASQAWDYKSYDRGKKVLNIMVNEVYSITSDWVKQSESDYLMDLFESPEVYWITEDGTTIAINITSNAIEHKKTINDQIINYTLTFELSFKNNYQKS